MRRLQMLKAEHARQPNPSPLDPGAAVAAGELAAPDANNNQNAEVQGRNSAVGGSGDANGDGAVGGGGSGEQSNLGALAYPSLVQHGNNAAGSGYVEGGLLADAGDTSAFNLDMDTPKPGAEYSVYSPAPNVAAGGAAGTGLLLNHFLQRHGNALGASSPGQGAAGALQQVNPRAGLGLDGLGSPERLPEGHNGSGLGINIVDGFSAVSPSGGAGGVSDSIIKRISSRGAPSSAAASSTHSQSQGRRSRSTSYSFNAQAGGGTGGSSMTLISPRNVTNAPPSVLHHATSSSGAANRRGSIVVHGYRTAADDDKITQAELQLARVGMLERPPSAADVREAQLKVTAFKAAIGRAVASDDGDNSTGKANGGNGSSSDSDDDEETVSPAGFMVSADKSDAHLRVPPPLQHQQQPQQQHAHGGNDSAEAAPPSAGTLESMLLAATSTPNTATASAPAVPSTAPSTAAAAQHHQHQHRSQHAHSPVRPLTVPLQPIVGRVTSTGSGGGGGGARSASSTPNPKGTTAGNTSGNGPAAAAPPATNPRVGMQRTWSLATAASSENDDDDGFNDAGSADGDFGNSGGNAEASALADHMLQQLNRRRGSKDSRGSNNSGGGGDAAGNKYNEGGAPLTSNKSFLLRAAKRSSNNSLPASDAQSPSGSGIPGGGLVGQVVPDSHRSGLDNTGLAGAYVDQYLAHAEEFEENEEYGLTEAEAIVEAQRRIDASWSEPFLRTCLNIVRNSRRSLMSSLKGLELRNREHGVEDVRDFIRDLKSVERSKLILSHATKTGLV